LGEDELIQATFAPLARGFPGAFGLEDDCALLTPPAGEDLVLTTDAVAAGVHFLPDDAPADIAWKALAVNVSDLAAKGARPIAYLLSVAFPERPGPAWLQELSRGLGEAQAAFGILLAGGDTDRRPGPVSLTVTAIGAVPKGRMVRRATARAGDLLFLSGTVGDSALGLRLRQDPERAQSWGLDEAQVQALVGRYLRPMPRIGLAPLLLTLASAAMDVSDGLVKDCARLARASKVAARLDARRLPLSAAAHVALSHVPDLVRTVVGGGDDYEILAAVPPDRAEAFVSASSAAGFAVTQIGDLGEGTGLGVTGLDGAALALDSEGWDHFR